MYKLCKDCSESKPASQYTQNRRSLDGPSFYCRDCANIRSRTYVNARRKADGTKLVKPRRAVSPGTKWCPRCELAVPLSEFGKNSGSRSGLTAYCKTCHNKVGREARIKTHGSMRGYRLFQRYGINLQIFEEMLTRQTGLCAACGTKPAEHVDHDHLTGKVRELLCFTCNVALGNVSDNIETLEALTAYLKRHQAKPLAAAQKRDTITVRIPTHRDFRFTIPRTVAVIDHGKSTLVDGRRTWPDSVTYERHLATR